LSAVLEAAGGSVERGSDGALLVQGLSISDIGDHAFRSGIAVHELSPHAGSLEERFLEWTRPAAPLLPSLEEVTRP